MRSALCKPSAVLVVHALVIRCCDTTLRARFLSTRTIGSSACAGTKVACAHWSEAEPDGSATPQAGNSQRSLFMKAIFAAAFAMAAIGFGPSAASAAPAGDLKLIAPTSVIEKVQSERTCRRLRRDCMLKDER